LHVNGGTFSPLLFRALLICHLKSLTLTRALRTIVPLSNFRFCTSHKDTPLRPTLDDFNDDDDHNDNNDDGGAAECHGSLASVLRQCQQLTQCGLEYCKLSVKHWTELWNTLQCHPTICSLELTFEDSDKALNFFFDRFNHLLSSIEMWNSGTISFTSL